MATVNRAENMKKLCCKCKKRNRYSTASYCDRCQSDWAKYNRKKRCRRCGAREEGRLKKEQLCAGCFEEWVKLFKAFMGKRVHEVPHWERVSGEDGRGEGGGREPGRSGLEDLGQTVA